MTDDEFANEVIRRLEWRRVSRGFKLYCGPLRVTKRAHEIPLIGRAAIENDIRDSIAAWLKSKAPASTRP